MLRTRIMTFFVVGVLASFAGASNPPGSDTPIIDSHVPEPNEPVVYELSLAPSVATPGELTALDPLDWYCFKAIQDTPISVVVQRASGGLMPNCGLLGGVVIDNTPMESLGQILAATNSLSTTSVTLNFTPNFSGPVTLYVSGALASIGEYTVTMTGGEERPSCSPCPTCVDMTLPPPDEAQFRIGTPLFRSGDLIDIPLIVDVHEDVVFSQMTIEYNDNCLIFVEARVGDDVPDVVTSTLDDNQMGAEDPNSTHNLTLQVASNTGSSYTGCDLEVFVVTFQFAAGFQFPCRIAWDRSFSVSNADNHLLYVTPNGDIDPSEINFCDGEISCDPSVQIFGTVLYYSNGEPIIAGVPDMSSQPVTVQEDDGDPSTTATSPDAEYSLDFSGPVNAELNASRPLVVCGTAEDGVISGDDVLALQNSIGAITDEKLVIAGDVNRDMLVDDSDVLGIKRWIARRVCTGPDGCGRMTNNCAGTWRFIFFTDPNDPAAFEVDAGNLAGLCTDQEVPIEGILVGDFDGSWPEFFAPKAASEVDLALDVKAWEGDEVLLALRANLDAGESLRHVIYSLDYDAEAFEYLGMRPGSKTSTWGWFDNPDVAGVAHGITHIPAHAEALTESGEVIVFRLRARNANASSMISFSRLKANDRDAVAPEIRVGRGNPVEAAPVPSQYSITSSPNPFNPSTRVTFGIPAGAGSLPVVLRIYDVSGHVVRTLVEGTRAPGYHHVVWDGDDAHGNASSAGVYLLRIEAGAWSSVEKLTLVK